MPLVDGGRRRQAWYPTRSGLVPKWAGRVGGVPTDTPADAGALLRRHGMPVTAQRLAVLRAVSVAPHITADDIHTIARGELGAISRQAVYDALAALTDRGVLRRIQ